MPWLIYAALAVAYLALARQVRYSRRYRIQKQFGLDLHRNLSSMTLDEAFEINRELALVEFPIAFATSLFLALFKTYGIPTISKLLVATGELANETTTSKRAADTGIILTEVLLHPPNSSRELKGIARMNFLHDRYRKAGKISDADMLYTLSLFVLEPMRWIDKLEWRSLSEVEKCAMATYWKALGDAMDVPYALLKSSTWHDGLHWLRELEEWSREYEVQHMKPMASNHQLAKGMLNVALYPLPVATRPQAMNIYLTLLEPRLRKAMMLDDPTIWHQRVVDSLLFLRKLVIRHLMLPRPWFLRTRRISEMPDAKTGRYHALRYRAHPWYVKPDLASRFGVRAWYLWALGRAIPGDKGEKFCPAGYHIDEIGPLHLVGKGAADMEQTITKLSERSTQGCPFALSGVHFPKA